MDFAGLVTTIISGDGSGPANLLAGGGLKIVSNIVVAIINIYTLKAAKDAEAYAAYMKQVNFIQNDLFSKQTRRAVFLSVAIPYAFAYVWFTIHAGMEVTTVADKTVSFLQKWIPFWPNQAQEIVVTAYHFVDKSSPLMEMLLGFYIMPTKR